MHADLTPAGVYASALQTYRQEHPQPGLLDVRCRICRADLGEPCSNSRTHLARKDARARASSDWYVAMANAAHCALDAECARRGLHPATVLHTDRAWAVGQ